MNRCATRRGSSVSALRWIAALLALSVGTATLRADPATEEGGHFEVRSAFLEPAEHVYQLNATLDLAMSRSFQQALQDGVSVLVELDLSIDRKRSLLPDKQIAAISQRWRIRYHALSERYLVNNLNSGQQGSYSTLAAALQALAQVRGLPAVDEALIDRGEHYEASVRVVEAIEGGMPTALKVMMFWVDWKRATDWYTWSVLP
jgi:hypothetical protein